MKTTPKSFFPFSNPDEIASYRTIFLFRIKENKTLLKMYIYWIKTGWNELYLHYMQTKQDF